MKTNRSGRKIVKIRTAMRVVALAAALAGELWLGVCLVGGVGRTSARPTEVVSVPSVNLADVMAAAR